VNLERSVMDSIWSAGTDAPAFAPLDVDLDADVAVIGAGITGITCAALLAGEGLRVVVLEAGQVGMGTTGRSTGNLYAPVDSYLHEMAAKWGEDKLAQVVRSRGAALDLIEKNTRDHRLDCGFARQPWALYSVDASKQHDKLIEREYQAALKCGLAARIVNELPLPYAIHRALVVAQQAQFHPLRYVRQLAAAIASHQCRIFEQSAATVIDEEQGSVGVGRHTVKARHIVMATHTPKGFNTVQTELGPYREYAVAAPLKSKQLAGGIFWSVGAEAHSTRLVELDGRPYVLMIGEMHKTGQNDDPGAAFRRLEAAVQAHFDAGPAAWRWSAQQYRPVDGLPYIGSSIGAARLYLATGFAADGLTYGTLAAMLIADQISGRTNEFVKLYSPHRFTPVKSAGAFLKENLNVAGRYVKDYLKGTGVPRLSEVPRGEGCIVEIGGDKLAVYRDESDQLHVVSPVCTHLKCIVHWNRAERSWDCPCHGSRFGVDGAVLEGPALAPLQRRAMPPDGGDGNVPGA
jgi:glycine/D-amino acid oxidase-like deaminating enzyme/nitrite reductase/ring-hydroxylating ferredoxin subunit